MLPVKRSPDAEKDLDDKYDYVRRDSQERASRELQKIRAAILMVAENPFIGKNVDHFGPKI